MKAITKFLEVLSENYYEQFLIEDPFANDDFGSKYFLEVEYKKKKFYELNVIEVSLLIPGILDRLKTKYNKAISETYLLISNKSASEINSIIENIKKSVVVYLEVIKSDFCIDNPKSRYHSVTLYSNPAFSLRKALYNCVDVINRGGRHYNSVSATYENFDLWYDYERDHVLSYLPAALFTVGRQFINELERIKQMAISNEVEFQTPDIPKLKWTGRPAHLGYIFGLLADSHFIDPPRKNDGEINYTKYAEQVFKIFEANVTEGTLAKYLNTTSEKALEAKRKFDEAGFIIPHKNILN